MKLAIISHKPCSTARGSASGIAADGGFPVQVRALSELFTSTTLLVPVSRDSNRTGLANVEGHNMRVVALEPMGGSDFNRKLAFPGWFIRNARVIIRELLTADVVHSPIPGDIGTVGMLAAFFLRKKLFVRHCGNWFARRTAAEFFWRWFMETFATEQRLMFATGGSVDSPSLNQNVRWIFSSSLSVADMPRSNRTDAPGGGVLKLLIACRQEPGKGAAALVEALPVIAEQFPGVTLDIIGDGSAISFLSARIVELGLSDRVVLHGQLARTAVLEHMKAAHVFCYPTASEGFPKVVLEAMACGLPVVTTRVSVLPYLLKDGGGVLLKGTSPKDIAAGVLESISSPAGWCSLSSQAVARAREFTIEAWQQALRSHFERSWGSLTGVAEMPRVAYIK